MTHISILARSSFTLIMIFWQQQKDENLQTQLGRLEFSPFNTEWNTNISKGYWSTHDKVPHFTR